MQDHYKIIIVDIFLRENKRPANTGYDSIGRHPVSTDPCAHENLLACKSGKCELSRMAI